MNDSSHGYDVSVEYGHGFCPEMAPDWLDLSARIAGHRPPRDSSAPFRFLELGAGQGTGLCLLAAANPHGAFVGVDFQPEHVAHASALADQAGLTNIRFVEADFLDLAETWPGDFGAFDYVGLHGVYSWMAPELRAAIVTCLAHATKPGGLVYCGYNTQPGWLGTVPFQHITRRLHQGGGGPGSAAFDASIALFDRLRSGGADTFRILPGLKTRLDSVRTRKASYLIHEYLHAHWRPLWHSELADDFERAGLAYVGSATLAETMLPDVLPPPLRAAIVAQTDAGLREDVQDFVINQSFRRDVFVRAAGASAKRDVAALAELRIHLLSPPAPDGLTVKAAFGEIRLQHQAYDDIVAALGDGPKSIAALAALPGNQGQGIENVLQIVLLLLHTRTLALAPPVARSTARAEALNAVIARGAADGLPYDHIAAAATGSAIAASETELLMLDCWFGGARQADAKSLADGALERLPRLQRPGEELSPNVTAAKAFLDETLPRWRTLGAIDH